MILFIRIVYNIFYTYVVPHKENDGNLRGRFSDYRLLYCERDLPLLLLIF